MQYSPNPHSSAKPDYARFDRVAHGLGATRQDRPRSASSYSLLHPVSLPSRMGQLFQAFRLYFHITGIRLTARIRADRIFGNDR